MTTETERLAAVEAKLDAVIEETRARFASLESYMESRFNSIESRFNSFDSRFNSTDSRFGGIETRINAQLALSFLTLIAVVGALVTLIIKS